MTLQLVGNRCSRSGVRNVPVPYSSWGPVPNTDRVLSRTIRSMLLACHCVSVCLSLELCACVTKQSPRPLALALSAHGANNHRPSALALSAHSRRATQQDVLRRCGHRSVSATTILVSPPPLLLAVLKTSHRLWCVLLGCRQLRASNNEVLGALLPARWVPS